MGGIALSPQNTYRCGPAFISQSVRIICVIAHASDINSWQAREHTWPLVAFKIVGLILDVVEAEPLVSHFAPLGARSDAMSVSHMSKTTLSKLCEIFCRYCCGGGSVLRWRQRNTCTLRSSWFVDNVCLSINGLCGAWLRDRIVKVTHQGQNRRRRHDMYRTTALLKMCASVSTSYLLRFLVHGQVTIIFVVSVGLSVCLFVCLFVQSFSQPSLIRFRSN